MTGTARSRGIARALLVTTSREALLAMAVLLSQILALVVYVDVTDMHVTSVQAMLYPVIWITLSVYFVAFLSRYAPPVRHSWVAMAIGSGYFLVLAAIAGLVWPSQQFLGDTQLHSSGLSLLWAPPGWGPVVTYSNSFIQLTLIPFKLVGYLALAYGIATAVTASSRGALAGLVGVFSCVGCVLPLIAVVTGIFGSASSLLATLGGSYEVGTAVFALTIGILLVTIPTRDPFSTT